MARAPGLRRQPHPALELLEADVEFKVVKTEQPQVKYWYETRPQSAITEQVIERIATEFAAAKVRPDQRIALPAAEWWPWPW